MLDNYKKEHTQPTAYRYAPKTLMLMIPAPLLLPASPTPATQPLPPPDKANLNAESFEMTFEGFASHVFDFFGF